MELQLVTVLWILMAWQWNSKAVYTFAVLIMHSLKAFIPNRIK